jgi:MFS family permease
MKNKNFRLLLYSNSIAYFAFQFIGPFFVIFLNQKGGSIENLGMLYGISVLMNAITAFYTGRFSDKMGRKPFLIVSGIAVSFTTVAYIYVKSLFQLYALQVLNGIFTAMWAISEQAMLADVTTKTTRGKMMGVYNFVLGILMSIGLMSGGFLIGKFGFEVIFWGVAIINLISMVFIFFIKEKETRKEHNKNSI